MDENDNSKETEKAHTEKNTKDALQAAEKGAAMYFGGPAGSAAVNALHSAPVVGNALNKIEDKAAEKLGKNKNIANMANALGDSGATNAINKGMDVAGAAGGGGAGTAANGTAASGAAAAGKSATATEAANGINDTLGKIPGGSKSSSTSEDDESSEVTSATDIQANIQKTAKVIKFIAPAIPYILSIFVTVIVVIMVIAGIMSVVDKIEGAIVTVMKTEQKLQNFVTGEGWRTEDDAFFYKLKEVYQNYGQTSDVPLDVPLLSATIHYTKIIDLNVHDGDEGEHDDDVGEGENSYSSSQDSGFGSSIIETYQTWSFYQMANVKLGSYSTLIPGQRGLLGHLVKTEIKWGTTCISKAPGAWLDFFEQIFDITTLNEAIKLNEGSVGAGILEKISDFLGSGIGIITGFSNLLDDISAFAAQDSSYLDWWSANVLYETNELVEFFTKNYDDSRLVEAGYSYYNNLPGTGTQSSESSIVGVASSYKSLGENETDVDSNGNCIFEFPYPYVVRSMDYKAYYRYLVNVYIPVTYYRGLKVDEDYSFLEVVNTANAIFDQKYLYEYLVDESEKNLMSGCGYTFSGESTQIEVDTSMIGNLYVNVLDYAETSRKGTNIVETVSLRDYVIGVTYREIAATVNDNEEYLKANIIAIKSYTVGRPHEMGDSITQDGDKYYLVMRNNTNDQVYCSLTKGCMDAPSNPKPAPSPELIEYLGKLYDEVSNIFLYDTNSSNFVGSYRSTQAACIGRNLVGSCLGQEESEQMGDSGSDWQSILGFFYTGSIGKIDISTGQFSTGVITCISSGLELGTDGFYQRTEAPESNNIYFSFPYVSDLNRGQCVWYVKGRAQEIIANSKADASKKETAKKAISEANGNGNDWYSNGLTSVFGSSTDYTQPKAGAIAVYDWTDAQCRTYYSNRGESGCPQKYGHSLIVEAVDGNQVSISEGWTSCPTGEGIAWSCVKFSYSTHDIEYMKDLGGGYIFIGYVYLLD